jgi:hypothetical protein
MPVAHGKTKSVDDPYPDNMLASKNQLLLPTGMFPPLLQFSPFPAHFASHLSLLHPLGYGVLRC